MRSTQSHFFLTDLSKHGLPYSKFYQISMSQANSYMQFFTRFVLAMLFIFCFVCAVCRRVASVTIYLSSSSSFRCPCPPFQVRSIRRPAPQQLQLQPPRLPLIHRRQHRHPPQQQQPPHLLLRGRPSRHPRHRLLLPRPPGVSAPVASQ